MRYGSVCSGIEAATVAWHPLGWTPAWFSEIEPFPCAVLAHHYLSVPNMGDMTTIRGRADVGPIDLLVGGTPCQSFSVAGLRKGLADPRGNLALVFLGIADALRSRWVVWENVPGVLSSAGGRDFGAFLGGLAELGYGWAYRVLDAQYVRVESHARAVPQRRRRVFVVGHLGDWRRAAAVLLERESMCGHPPPSRGKGEGTAGCLAPGAHPGGFNGQDAYAGNLIGFSESGQGWWREGVAGLRADPGGMPENVVAHSLRAAGHDASEDGTGRGTPIVPIDMRQASRGERMTNNRREGSSGGAPGTGIGEPGDPCPTLADSHTPAVAFTQNQAGDVLTGAVCPSMGTNQNATGRNTPKVYGSGVRRLTPRECERLQGFPDDYTLIPYRNKPAADAPRYKALGNSMAVNVMSWIGQRIAMADRN